MNKNFPADTDITFETFLSDSKVSAELYGYLQSISVGEAGETRVYKSKMLSLSKISTEILGYKSRNTAQPQFKYLKDKGYVIDEGEYYLLPLKERIYFKMPIELLRFFVNTLKEPVLKTYIYLGQRYSYRPGEYVFTTKEICEHLGIDYSRNYTRVADYLTVLEKLNLIKIARFNDGVYSKMRLIGFSK